MSNFKEKQGQGNPDPRAGLKDYLKNSSLDIVNYLKKTEKARINSVYNETSRPSDAVRVWVSFDFSGNDKDRKYKCVDDWSKANQAETWGNSVRTFLWKWEDEVPTNGSVAQRLVEELIHFGILNNNEWQSTPNTSIYVFYRYSFTKEKEIWNSDHFVLILNAPIPHEDNIDKMIENQK